MAEYVVTGPDGKEYEVTAPEGATEAQIIRQVQSYINASSAPEPTQEDPGFWGGLGNSIARFGGRVGTMYDNYMAEQLAQAADAEAEMQRRRESGEMSTLDRLLTWRPENRREGGVDYESPEALRNQAAGYIASGAQRTQDFAQRFPMTRAGGQAISDLSQAESFGEGAQIVFDRPLDVLSGVAQVGAEQIPTLGAAMVGTAVTRNPNVGVAIMGASTYGQERFGQMQEVAQEMGYDITDPVQARAAIADEGFLAAQEERGMTRGMVIATIDALTLKAGSALLPNNLKGLAGNTALQMGSGAGGEALAQQLTLGEVAKPGEVIVEGLAEGPFAAAEVLGVMRNGGNSETRPDALDPQAAAEEALLAQQAEEEQAVDERAVRQGRVAAELDLMSFKDFQRIQNEDLTAAILDPNTAEGQDFRTWIAETRDENNPVPRTEAELRKAAAAYIKDSIPPVGYDAFSAILDDHVAYKAEAAQRTPEAAAQAEQLRTELIAERAAARQSGDAEAIAAVEAKAAEFFQPGEWRYYTLQADNRLPAAPKKGGLGANFTVQTTAPAAPKSSTTSQAAGLSANASTPKPVSQQAPAAPAAPQAGEAPNVDTAALPQTDAQTTAPEAPTGPAQGDAPSLEAAADGTVNKQAPAQPTSGEAGSAPEADTTPPARPEAPRTVEMRSFAQEQLGENWEVDFPDIQVRFENRTGFYKKNTNGELGFQVAVRKAAEERAAEQQAEETAFTPQSDEQRINAEYAVRELGENWTQDEELTQILQDGKYGLFRREVDARAQEAETDRLERGGAGNAAAAFANDPAFRKTLSGQEQRLYDELVDAFTNNRVDDVMSVDGGFNSTAIAERLGFKGKQNVATALARIRKKMADFQGITEEQLVTRMAESALANRQVEAADEADATLAEQLGVARVTDGTAERYVMPEGMAEVSAGGAQTNDSAATAKKMTDRVKKLRAREIKQFKNAGMTDEQIAAFYAKQDEPESTDVVYQQKVEERRTATQQQEDALIEQNLEALESMWNARRSGDGPDFADLSQENKRSWLGAVREWAETNNDEQFDTDQRELEKITTKGAANGQANEQTSGPVESGASVQQQRTADVEVPTGSGGQTDTAAAPTDSASGAADGQAKVTTPSAMPASIPVGPTSLRPKPIGGTLYSDMNLEALNRMLGEVLVSNTEKGWVTQKWFSDNKDLALGQGSNTGIVVEFDGNYVSGAESSSKPAMAAGMSDGKEFRSDYINTNAIKSFTVPAGKKLRGSVSRLVAEKFDANTSEDGSTTYTAKTTDAAQAPTAYVDGKPVAAKAQTLVVTKANQGKKLRFATGEAGVKTATRRSFGRILRELTGNTTDMRVHVFDNEDAAIAAIEKGDVPMMDVAELRDVQPYGWVEYDDTGLAHAHFILDRIPAGGEMSAFMHEVGGHVGIDNILTPEEALEIGQQIADWYDLNDGSIEADIAQRAIKRVDIARLKGGVADGAYLSEVIAYFLEEASNSGITPESSGMIANFVNQIYDAFIRALKKIGIGNIDVLTPQDIVDMAYGAARLELVGDVKAAQAANTRSSGPRFGMPPQDRNTQISVKTSKTRNLIKKNFGDAAGQVYDGLAGLITAPIENLTFLYDLVENAQDKMPSAKVAYRAMQKQEAVRNSITMEYEKIANRAAKLSPERYAALNDFVGKSTFYQKWGYDPAQTHPELFKGRTIKVDPTMRAAWGRLSKDEQAIAADMFAQGEKMRQRIQAFMKMLGIKQNYFTSLSKLEGPYAPLKRFGNHVAVLKSAEVRALEAQVADKATSTPKLVRQLEELKSNPDHYVVQFFDTEGAAKRFAEANAKTNGGKYDRVEAFKRDSRFDNGRAPSTGVLEELLGRLKADDKSGLDDNAKEAFRKMLREQYFSMMDERDARTSGARRLNRAGYDTDMVRSFLFHGGAQAHMIATMEESSNIHEALAQMKREADVDRGNLYDTYSQISEHYTSQMAPENGIFNAIQDRVMAFNTVMMLTTNPAYHVQNATQTLVAVDKIAGDFGDYSGTWSAMFKGYKLASKAIQGGGLVRQAATLATAGLVNTKNTVEINVEALPPEYRPLVTELQQHQLADVGIQEDLRQFNRFDTGFGMLNTASDKVAGVTHRLYQVARYVEAYNRLSTAIAAYDMAKKNPQRLKALKKENATEYAISAVQRTQGAFNGLDAPLAFKKLPKGTTQYRKYQIMMGFNYGRALKQMFAGETAEIKWIGARTFSLLMAHTAITAGARGLPFVAPIAAVALMAFGDDEDDIADQAKAAGGYTEYMEQWIRDNVEDKRVADLLTRGVPAFFGLDFSGKMGHQNIFAFQPYSDLELTRDGIGSYAFDVIAGPTASTVRNFGAANEAAQRGDVDRAISMLMPKGVRNVLDTYRYANEGLQFTNQETMLDPRNIDYKSLMLNALGLPPTDIATLRWTRGQQFEIKQYFENRSARLRDQYAEARRNNDRDTMAELRDEWQELQRAKDRVRPFFNDQRGVLSRQPVSDLMRSARERERQARSDRKTLGTE